MFGWFRDFSRDPQGHGTPFPFPYLKEVLWKWHGSSMGMGVPLLGVPGIPLDWFMYGDDTYTLCYRYFFTPSWNVPKPQFHWGFHVTVVQPSVELVACFPNFPMIWWWLRGITQIVIGKRWFWGEFSRTIEQILAHLKSYKQSKIIPD